MLQLFQREWKSTFDFEKFKLSNQTVIRTLKNIKPLQFYFGSGIMDPIPLYKDYSEKEFAKLMGYDFIDTKDYLTRTQIVSKVKLGIKTVDILIKNKIFKFKGIGPGNIEEDLKFFENFSVKEFKDKLGITILGANEKKGLYTRHNLHTSIFNSKEFPNYGQLLYEAYR